MTRQTDRIPEEVAAQNQSLLHHLRQIYTLPAQDVRSLQRIQERLRMVAEHPLIPPQENGDSPALSEPEKPGSLPRPVRLSPASQRQKSWKRTLNLVAAILVLAILVGSFSIALSRLHLVEGHHLPPTVPSSVVPRPTRPAGQTSTLEGITMIDATTGWADGSDGTLLRTTDGGVHWQDMTPPLLLTQSQAFAVGPFQFFGASTAWIGLTPYLKSSTTTLANHSLILSTTDGGQSWTQTSLQTHGGIINQLVFPTAQDGWLLVNKGSTTSFLYQTHDGGKSWAPMALPSGLSRGTITSMSFANTQVGLLLGVQSAGNGSEQGSGVLYRTTDGGATWTAWSIPLSTNNASAYSPLFGNLRFLTNKEALFTATWSEQAQKANTLTAVFTTQDAGLTWHRTPVQSTPAPCNVLVPGGGYFIPQFIDTHYGLASCQASHEPGYPMLLYATSDGGLHWAQLHAFPFSSGYDVDMVSDQLSWCIGESTDSKTVLYKSMDGGHTWTQVQAHFPAFIDPPSAF